MDKIGFTGSFDPLTKGHLWVIEEALNFADEVIVFIAVNSSKNPMFTIAERILLIQKSTQHLNTSSKKVSVVAVEGDYTAQVAKEEYDCEYLIRGIRNAGDFDYESLIQQTNRDVLGGAKTIFVFPPRDLDSVSSSFVKSLVGPVGWHYYAEEFLPSAVINFWIEKEILKVIEQVLNLSVDNVVLLQNNVKVVKKKLMQLVQMYEGSNRDYHDKAHLLYMFQNMQKTMKSKETSRVQDFRLLYLLVAILGHDCIMAASDGVSAEELSAKYIENMELPLLGIEEIADAIRATEYLSNPDVGKYLENSSLAAMLVSLDLSILGSNAAIYFKYAKKVRREYLHVSNEDYTNGRIKALMHLCKLASNEELIPLEEFKHLNAKAYKNMSLEINSLRD